MTGRIITAAAAIMFCVFGSFVIKDPLHILKVFGLGLATAVLVDATLVRMALVPSIMEILGSGQLVAAAVDGPVDAQARHGGHPDAVRHPCPTPAVPADAEPSASDLASRGGRMLVLPMSSGQPVSTLRVPQPRARRAAGRHGRLPR